MPFQLPPDFGGYIWIEPPDRQAVITFDMVSQSSLTSHKSYYGCRKAVNIQDAQGVVHDVWLEDEEVEVCAGVKGRLVSKSSSPDGCRQERREEIIVQAWACPVMILVLEERVTCTRDGKSDSDSSHGWIRVDVRPATTPSPGGEVIDS